MAKIKMNAKGQVVIPKSVCKAFGLLPGIPLEADIIENRIVLKAAIQCYRCGKALPEEFRKTRLCPDCPPGKIVKVY